jgi:parallel beta-helix repeat protein
MNRKKGLFFSFFLLLIFIQGTNYNFSLIINSESIIQKLKSNQSVHHPIAKSMAVSFSNMTLFTKFDPIIIENNSVFKNFNFSGDGSISNPFLIDGYNITTSSSNLIHIQDTTAYFIISNNLLNGINGSFDGIFFSNVMNGNVSNNLISNCMSGIALKSSSINNFLNNTIDSNVGDGIHLEDSNSNFINDNDIYGTETGGGGSGSTLPKKNFAIHQTSGGGNGIFLDPSNDNIISNNNIFNNSGSGILLNQSENNTIYENDVYRNDQNGIFFVDSHNNLIDGNDIYGNDDGGGSGDSNLFENRFSIHQTSGGGNGIFLDPSNRNNITNNQIHGNSRDGISLINSEHNLIDGNNIYNNGAEGGGSGSTLYSEGFSIHQTSGGGNGIFLDPSDFNTISNNELLNNSAHGVYLVESDETNIFFNTISTNRLYGIIVSSDSMNNKITCNNFLGNNQGEKQASDSGKGNFFGHNYWSDHTNLDQDDDGIADEFYRIAGTTENKDETPTISHNEMISCPVTAPTTTRTPGLTTIIIFLSFMTIIITIKMKNRGRRPSKDNK